MTSTAADQRSCVIEGIIGHDTNDYSISRSIENRGSRMSGYEPRPPMDRAAQGQSSSSPPPERAGGNGLSPRLMEHMQFQEASTVPNLLVGEREHGLYVLKAPQVEHIEADGNYVKFHVDGAEYIGRASIKRLSAQLANSGFVRIERSLWLNVRAIPYVQRTSHGRYAFTLISGECVNSGAKYRSEILRVDLLRRAPKHDRPQRGDLCQRKGVPGRRSPYGERVQI